MQVGAFQGQAEQAAGGDSSGNLLAKLCVKLLLNPRSVEGVMHGCVGVGGISADWATLLFRFAFVDCVSAYFKAGNDIRRCQVKQAIDHGLEKTAVQLEVDTQRYPASL